MGCFSRVGLRFGQAGCGGVGSVQGVSADVVVFEVGLSVQVGGIVTIGGFGRRVAGVSGAYGRKTPMFGL